MAWVMGAAHSVACTVHGSLGVASLDSQLVASVQAVQAGRQVHGVLQVHSHIGLAGSNWRSGLSWSQLPQWPAMGVDTGTGACMAKGGSLPPLRMSSPCNAML